jgi:hypothetical protein
MKRNPNALLRRNRCPGDRRGGIYGVPYCLEAVLQGLRVALIEKKRFCFRNLCQQPENHSRGLRYLQHLDLARTRESIVERRVSAPLHRIKSIPCPASCPPMGI